MKMFAPNGLLVHVADDRVDELLAKGWERDGSDDLPASTSAREEARKPAPNTPRNRATAKK